MRTKTFLATLVTLIGAISANAQTNLANSSISSGGLNAGTIGTGNAFYGYRAGYLNTSTGLDNTFIGHQSGRNSTTGDSNIFLGNSSGYENTSGTGNIYIGINSGYFNTTSTSNVFVGTNTGANDVTGSRNTYIGYSAGGESSGSDNVFLGYQAGFGETASNRLYIDNSENWTPLIWGDFASDLLKFNGKVGIGLGTNAFPNSAGGITVSNYKLIVNGGVLATEVRVATTWADYVFEDNYKLASLEDVECYIEENGHLPNVPSAEQIEADGIEVGQMAKLQQEKIEELTLYLIAQNKQLEEQRQEIDELKSMVQSLCEKQ